MLLNEHMLLLASIKSLGIKLDEEHLKRLKRSVPEWNEALARAREIYEDTQLFHGSRHFIDGQFALEKVNTGEGAQVFGWGIYMAENRQVAEYYRTAGAKSAFNTDGIRLPSGETFIFNEKKQQWLDKHGTDIVSYLKAKKGIDVSLGLGDWLSKVYDTTQYQSVGADTLTQRFRSFMQSYMKKAENLQNKAKRYLLSTQKEIAQIEARLNSKVHGPKSDSVRQMMIDEIEDLRKDEAHHQEMYDKGEADYFSFEYLSHCSVYNAGKSTGVVPKGNLYEITGPDKDDFLNWDAPISKQPKIKALIEEMNKIVAGRNLRKTLLKCRSLVGESCLPYCIALLQWYKDDPDVDYYQVEGSNQAQEIRNHAGRNGKFVNEAMKLLYKWISEPGFLQITSSDTGEQCYHKLSDGLGSDKAASLWLNDHGVPALFYFDAFSRSFGGRKTYNWVIFNTDIVKIMKVSGEFNKTFF